MLHLIDCKYNSKIRKFATVFIIFIRILSATMLISPNDEFFTMWPDP